MTGAPTSNLIVPSPAQRLRLRLRLQGVVQGVGFRPQVYRLAAETGVSGWVGNCNSGVIIEVEGAEPVLQEFHRRLGVERPPGSSIQSLEAVWLEPVGWKGFEIRPSTSTEPRTAVVRPDVATCPDCIREIFDARNRRYGYPFTNCTHCGPRYTIIESLPYDRARTSMKHFPMCPACRAEYEDPSNRRFHAQPNACPACGPQLEYWSHPGGPRVRGREALGAALAVLRRGQILAVKGLGGFHLITDARSESSVKTLRSRKHRDEKPFALMTTGVRQSRDLCEVRPLEERVLCSPEAPIVLLRRRVNGETHIAEAVAPGNPFLGIMLPYTPLHHLLMADLGFPVVATSGNLSDEPICINEAEASERLSGIADAFLVHNRPILRHVDDSVVRVIAQREMVVRRARGYAPLPVLLGSQAERESNAGASKGSNLGTGRGAGGVLAVGAHLKNSVALGSGNAVMLSQHIGDLDTPAALSAFRRVTADLQRLFEIEPDCLVSDLHPDYVSTREAQARPGRHVAVQHHFAHILSCLAENELEGPVLGIAWDGTGYGPDGTLWGGEFLVADLTGYDRFATLRPFRLPGGECAIREPRRSAMGVLFEYWGDSAFELENVPSITAFTMAELAAVRLALRRKFNAPVTSAVGRLFDAVASLTNVRQMAGFEGQAAMALEWLALKGVGGSSYQFQLRPAASGGSQPRVPTRDAVWQADWAPLIGELLEDRGAGASPARMAAAFHRALIQLAIDVAAKAGLERVALSGGCFQNVVLLEGLVERLRNSGHRVYWHQRVPTNDGGLALGQTLVGLNLREPVGAA